MEEECYDPKKEYYQKVKERLDKTHYCKCGGTYHISRKLQHFRTNKHLNYMDCDRFRIGAKQCKTLVELKEFMGNKFKI
jgi:hypothetical protein